MNVKKLNKNISKSVEKMNKLVEKAIIEQQSDELSSIEMKISIVRNHIDSLIYIKRNS